MEGRILLRVFVCYTWEINVCFVCMMRSCSPLTCETGSVNRIGRWKPCFILWTSTLHNVLSLWCGASCIRPSTWESTAYFCISTECSICWGVMLHFRIISRVFSWCFDQMENSLATNSSIFCYTTSGLFELTLIYIYIYTYIYIYIYIYI